jgi:hypothetical protein
MPKRDHSAKHLKNNPLKAKQQNKQSKKSITKQINK